ncbi:MAG: HNH endonuclease [Planctomycetota bacterium]
MKNRPKRSPDGDELRALPEKYGVFRNAYMVTMAGDITRIRAASGTRQFKVLKPSNGPHGYLTVSLKVAPTEQERLQAMRAGRELKPRHQTFLVHKLVVEAFRGPVPDGCEVHHVDGDKTNNSLSNLAIVDRDTHINLTVRAGQYLSGLDNPMGVLSDGQIREIRARRAQSERVKDLAAEFGVSRGHISGICSGKKRRHVALHEEGNSDEGTGNDGREDDDDQEDGSSKVVEPAL